MTAAQKTIALRIQSLNEELAGCTTLAQARCVRETLEATEAQQRSLINGHWPSGITMQEIEARTYHGPWHRTFRG